IETSKVDTQLLERDPGLRHQIWDYNVNQRDEMRRAYIMSGPYQPRLPEYPKSGSEKHPRRFQSLWFDSFPSWLAYSPTKMQPFVYHVIYLMHHLHSLSILLSLLKDLILGRRLEMEKNCTFLNHVGKDPNSTHKKAERSCFAFRGHDESEKSSNRGNFIQLLKAFGFNNEKVAEVILDKAPKFASYTSPDIQKEILHVFSMRVKKTIREEIRDAKFCLIVDESRDESKKEQMAIVLRFVDNNGFLQERFFFCLVHVSNTSAATLKDGIYYVLSHHNLNIQNIRGQGYDSASNMLSKLVAFRSVWHGCI
ncbi:hypothetical protein CICLE_v10024402mg, partial [Citrus x clementina]